jgi:hypothetical protein
MRAWDITHDDDLDDWAWWLVNLWEDIEKHGAGE